MVADPLTIDLNGWDTAFALRLKEFNRQLGSHVDSTHRQIESNGDTLEWSFRDPSVISASGGTVDMEVGFIGRSRLTLGAPSGARRIVDVSGYRATLEAQLALKPGIRGDTTHSLRGTALNPTRPWVQITVTAPDGGGEFRIQAVMAGLLRGWLETAAGLEWFDACFDALSVDTPADPATWLQPRVVGFAGATLEDGDAVIGLLGKIEADASPLGALLQVSPYAIHENAVASFMMSSHTFLTHLLVPALARVFTAPDRTEPAFEIRDAVVWNTAQVRLALKTKDGKEHLATIPAQCISIAIIDDLLMLSIEKMGFDIKLGEIPVVHVDVTVRENLRAHIRNVEGKTVFLLECDNTDVLIHDEETLYALGGELLVSVITAIGSALLARVGPGFLVGKGLSIIGARILTAVVILVADSIGFAIARVPDILANFEGLSLEEMPDFSALISHSISPIHWRSGVEYTVTGGRFAGALQVDLASTTSK